MKTRLRVHLTGNMVPKQLLVLQILKESPRAPPMWVDATVEDLTELMNLGELLNENPIKQ